MLKVTVWTAALLLAGMSASADAALIKPAEFEQSAISGQSIDGYTASAEKSKTDYAAEMAQLHAWLRSEAAPIEKGSGIRVELSPQERYSIGEIDACSGCEQVESSERRLLVGVSREVGHVVNIAALAKSGRGLQRQADGGLVFTLPVSSRGAVALRVGFSGLDLPVGAELYVYNSAGEAHGPYTGRGMGNGELVSNSVTGDTAWVQLRMYGKPNAAELAKLNFQIASVGHIGPKFELSRRLNATLAGEKAFCDYNATCVINGECASGWTPLSGVRSAVAHMLFKSGGGYYICSGGLLNNSNNDGSPLFLTANHCLSREREADTLETFFDFRTDGCGSTNWCDYSYTQMRSSFPTTLGAAMLASGSSGDFSLMRLDATPAGTRHFMGWSTTAVANSNGTDLHRMSHPGGSPQAYSTHDVNANGFQCGTLPRGTYIYSNDSAGATEGGSSGSPVLNAAGQVVGQLYGACGSNLDDTCDATNNLTVDGALAQYFPNVSAYLDPAGGGGGGGGGEEVVASVDSVSISSSSKGPWTHYTATVSISDASGNPIGSATVGGTWSGALSGSASGTTDGSGTASITGKTRSPGSVSFCVTSVAGSGVTFDGNTVCGSN